MTVQAVANREDLMELTPLLVSKKKTATLLDVSLRKVDYLIAERKLETRNVGRRVLVTYRSLVKFAGITARTRTSATDVGDQNESN